MTDERPRPQYGEYATPEQQAAAMGIEYVPADRQTPPAPGAVAAGTSGASAHPAPSARDIVRDIPAPEGVTVTPVRPYDRILTYVLLGLATWSLITSIPGYVDFASEFNDQLSRLGMPEYSQPALATQIGITLLVVQAVLYVVTFWISLTRLRHGRRAFFVPIVGAAIFLAISSALFIIAFHADPAVWEKLTTGSIGG